jgi:predicted MFS family arabinose efflux permease
MVKASIQLYKNAYSGLPAPIWWLAGVIFVNRSGTMVIPFLTVYLTQKGFTLAEAGYVMGCFGLGAVVGAYAGGKLTDRFNFHYVQFFSLLLNGILFFVLAEMKTLQQFMICIFVLSSLGEAFRPANGAAIAAYSTDENRTRSYSLNRLAINLGWSIGPAVGGLLASFNYKLLFWADGFTCIAAALLLNYFLSPIKKSATEKQVEPEVPLASAYRDGVFLQGMFYVFLVGLCFFQLFSILPVYYKNNIHMNEAAIGWLLASNGVLIVLFEMILVYKLERRGRVVRYIGIGASLIGLSFLSLNLAPIVFVVIFSMLIVTLGEMMLFPFINNFWVSRSNHANRGQYAAMYTISFSLANVLAPTIAAQIAAKEGFRFLWTIDFFVCIIAAIGFVTLHKKIK